MSVIGLTGNLACGKSSVLKMLKKKGASVFDSDRFVHDYYKNKRGMIYKKIVKLFPECLKGGAISRKKLSRMVFSDQRSLKALERIVHPVIIKDLLTWVKRAKKKEGIHAAEVPLLFEKKLDKYFDEVVLVTAKRPLLIQRMKEKYKFSKAEILDRLSIFGSSEVKKKGSDFFVKNNSDFKQLQKEVDLLWKKLNQK